MKNISRNKFKIKIDSNKPLSEIKPHWKARVLSKCKSTDYNEAKTEWEPLDLLDETSEGFSATCDLCGCVHLKRNFVIYNPHTEATMKVGSRCIIRFGLFTGNIDITTGARIINNFVDEKFLLNEIRGLASSVMNPSPEYSVLNDFLKGLTKYFGMKGIKDPTIEQLGEAVFGSRKEEILKNSNNSLWLLKLWERPDMIPVVKTGKVSKLPAIKEGTTWYKKRKGAFISDTFGRSGQYNVQKYVEDNFK